MSGSSTITRALTKRQKRPEVSAPMPYHENNNNNNNNHQSQSQGHSQSHSRSSSHQFKFASGTIKRNKISGPVDLVSSTNLIAYTSPDIQHSPSKSTSKSHPKSSPSSSSSSSSLRSGGSDTDIGHHHHHSSTSSPATSPEALSLETSSPTVPTDGPSHKPGSFGYSHRRSSTDNSSARSRISSSTTSSTSKVPPTPPSVPQRSLSHSKRSHQDLARQRSRSKMNAPPPTSISSTHASRVTQDLQTYARPQPPDGVDAHPFGKELEQVNEVAEEFGGYAAEESDEEERELLAKGFCKFSVEDYLLEIQDLYRTIFHVSISPPGAGWI